MKNSESNVLSFQSAQLSQLLKEKQARYHSEDAVAGMLFRLFAGWDDEDALKFMDSGIPYVKLWHDGSRYTTNVLLGQFKVDEWHFHVPRDSHLPEILLPTNGKFVVIPWGEICSSFKRRTWFSRVDVNSAYWGKQQSKLIEAWLEQKQAIGRESLLEELDSKKTTFEKSIDARICNLEISAGTHENREGFFGHYRKKGLLFCIRFCRSIYRSNLTGYLDTHAVQDFRVPWKQIVSGESFKVDVVLSDYFQAHAGSGFMKDSVYLEDTFKFECQIAAERRNKEWEIRTGRPRRKLRQK